MGLGVWGGGLRVWGFGVFGGFGFWRGGVGEIKVQG